jgi:hypothetical protein
MVDLLVDLLEYLVLVAAVLVDLVGIVLHFQMDHGAVVVLVV